MLHSGPNVGSSTASAHRPQRLVATPQPSNSHPSGSHQSLPQQLQQQQLPSPLSSPGSPALSPAQLRPLPPPRHATTSSLISSSSRASSPAPSCPLPSPDASGLSRNFVNALPPSMPDRSAAMSNSNTSPSPGGGGGGYLEQTASLLSSVGSYMRLPALASTGVAAVVTTLLYFKQKALIYPSHMPPNSRTEVPHPSQFGIKDFEELVIPTEDGEKLSAFYIRGPRGHQNSNITILMFHGNAGNIGHRLPIARMIMNYIGCNVFMLEYRGYGASTGEPDESGLNIDAQTALDYLRQRAETRNHQLVIYGQSLGGAVSIKLAAKNQEAGDILGMVLENTFLSMRKLIPSVIPPARYLTLLCHQVWPSESILPNVKVPVLFLSGLQDEIVPPSHMRQLYDLCKAPTKKWRPLPGGDHNSSVLEEGYFEAISDFIVEITSETAKDEAAL